MLLSELRRDTRGASAAEYAVILALLGSGIGLATMSLSKSVACSMTNSGSVIAGDFPENSKKYGHSDPKGLAKGQHRKRCQ
jgi:Flp pilus assembly pilin Flp